MCITILNTKLEILSLRKANGISRELGLERFPTETVEETSAKKLVTWSLINLLFCIR